MSLRNGSIFNHPKIELGFNRTAPSELDYDYDLDDQPIRLFLLRDDQVLLSIERDNFERPVS